ncbi:hypothetical protein ACQPV1_18460 [Clostridium neonatale]|uniref:hypothetical protein n=1 Tax=Clostridium neonatale TaxID=137838 RepID=UPI003D34DAA3
MEIEGDSSINILKSHLDSRLDLIEEMIKLSLVTDIMNQVDSSLINNCKCGIENKELNRFITDNNLHLYKSEQFGEKIAVYIISKKKLGIKDIRQLVFYFKEQYVSVIPVFMFEKINSIIRKKMEDEKISYYIKNKELHICF